MPGSNHYSGPERRAEPHLDDEALERLATRAADLAVERMTNNAYRAIGKGLVERLLWLIGLIASALYLWGVNQGWIKP